MRIVVETNVPIAANGRDTHARLECQLTCIQFLEKITSAKSRDKILLDNKDLIFNEYKTYLNFHGQPGVGDIFFKFLHDNLYLNTKVQLVPITPVVDTSKGYDELPVNTLDKSDQKFLAVAVRGKGIVFNAMDTDWFQQSELTKSLSVNVRQLCPEHGCCARTP